MSVLVVGISHKSAPVAVLERLALEPEGVEKLIHDVAAAPHTTEATVVATCNRLEIFAEVDRFHGSVEELSRLLVERSGQPMETLLPHLYVHYDDAAVSHLLRVSAGLDSMVVGEGQVLGQVRGALRLGQELGTVGPALNLLFQQALRVGKRTRAETDIDRVAPSLVTAALERVGGDLTGRRVLVIGAGSMASLAVATASRQGAGEIVVLNRTHSNGDRLAREYSARALPLSELTSELATADVVIACTGAGSLVTVDDVRTATRGERDLVLIDLALPHDIDPAVATLPRVGFINLALLADELADADSARDVADVRRIVSDELGAFLSARKQASVTPTVVALRTMATGVVDAEMTRLDQRLPGLDEASRAEILHALRRVSDKLLHQPTVRVKELANATGAVSYAAALAELFALDPDAVDAVTRPDPVTGGEEQ